MSREGSDAEEEAGDDLKPLPGGGAEADLAGEGGGQKGPQPPPPSGPDEHEHRIRAKRMSFRQSKKQRRQVGVGDVG